MPAAAITLPRTFAVALVAISLASSHVTATDAQTTDQNAHAGHMMTGTESPATQAFMVANARMHESMALPFTGDTDVDFITGMIPHHQGAVDMARIVLAHGTDPEVRAFAQQIIDAQEAEIAWMTDWLARHGH
jgi:uncharacterized protein (DUF305 family)